MGNRAWRHFTSVVVIALLLVGCQGWTTEQARWSLVEEPTGQELRVVAEFGGSSCTRFKQWQVDETPESVEIVALIERSGADDCTLDLVIEEGMIELETPLGDRTLTGCSPDGDADCREVVVNPG